MTLLHASALGLAFGSRTVFDGLTFTIEEGERVGLVGVNGSGKSSLMRMLARAAEPDRGEIQLRRGATVTYLPQEPAFPDNPASERISRKLGYEPDGLERIARRGAPVDARRFRLTREAWERTPRLDVDLAGVEPCLPLLGAAPKT